MRIVVTPPQLVYPLPDRFVLTGSDTARVRERVLVPGRDYFLDAAAGEFRLNTELAPGDTVRLSYRALLLPLAGASGVLVPRMVPPRPQGSDTSFARPEGSAPAGAGTAAVRAGGSLPGAAPAPGASLAFTGNKTVAVDFGNTRDLALRQSLDLHATGRVAAGVDVLAVLSDRNTPVSTEGSTRELRELDKLLLEIKGPGAGATLGDLSVSEQRGTFARFNRELSGVAAQGRVGGLDGAAVLAGVKGVFVSRQFNGVDGVQGPYVLSDDDGRTGIAVVAGSETVWLDGVRQARGETADYSMDYDRGTLTFSARRLVSVRLAHRDRLPGRGLGLPPQRLPGPRRLDERTVRALGAGLPRGRRREPSAAHRPHRRGPPRARGGRQRPLGRARRRRERRARRLRSRQRHARRHPLHVRRHGAGHLQHPVRARRPCARRLRRVDAGAGPHGLPLRRHGQRHVHAGAPPAAADRARRGRCGHLVRAAAVGAPVGRIRGSRYDANTFSALDDEMRNGAAGQAGITLEGPVAPFGKAIGRLGVTGEIRRFDERYRSPGRLDPVFYEEEWGVNANRPLKAQDRKTGILTWRPGDEHARAREYAELSADSGFFARRRGVIADGAGRLLTHAPHRARRQPAGKLWARTRTTASATRRSARGMERHAVDPAPRRRSTSRTACRPRPRTRRPARYRQWDAGATFPALGPVDVTIGVGTALRRDAHCGRLGPAHRAPTG
jgi:hypothetical protein